MEPEQLKFKKIETPIGGLRIIEPKVFGDSRGFFMESWNKEHFKNIGLNVNFVQDNHSKSSKAVLRGLHLQTKNPQGKLVRCIRGKIFDVAIDLRKDSPTLGKYYGIVLSEENKKMFYIPEGFAHGFLALEDNSEFLYKTTDYYFPENEIGIIWNDAEIGINWPFKEYAINLQEIKLSEKDKNNITFKEYKQKFLNIA